MKKYKNTITAFKSKLIKHQFTINCLHGAIKRIYIYISNTSTGKPPNKLWFLIWWTENKWKKNPEMSDEIIINLTNKYPAYITIIANMLNNQ